jgi:hypothetical protein
MPDEVTAEDTSSAAEIHAELLAEDKGTADVDNDKAPPKTEEESESENVTADEDVIKGEEDDEDEGDDEDLPLSETLTLDDNVREKFPEEAKRWDQQVKGLSKIEKRLKGEETNLNTWMSVDSALADKKTAPEAARKLAKIVADRHGMTVHELLGVDATTQDDDDKLYSDDDTVVAKASKAALDAFKSDPDYSEWLAEKEKGKQATAEKEWFDRRGGAIVARVEKTVGWKPTERMVLEARREFPEVFREDALKALKKAFPDDYLKSQTKPTKKTPPDIVESATSKGFTIPDDPMEYSARHARMEEGV